MNGNESFSTNSHENTSAKKLLFVSANGSIQDDLLQSFSGQGYQCRTAEKFSEAFELLLTYNPEIVFLNSSGNELAALELCNAIKSMDSQKKSIVIILSSRNDEAMEIASFQSGANDFVLFPVKVNALIERVKALQKSPNNSITVTQDYQGALPLKIDREAYSVSLGNHFIQLSRKEFELLFLMASHPDKLFGRDEIFQLIWNKKSPGKNRTIDVHISRLRQKLGNRFISSQKGIGYRFNRLENDNLN